MDTELFDCAGLGEIRKEIGHKVAHLKTEDISDALIYILGTPSHVQVSFFYFWPTSCLLSLLH